MISHTLTASDAARSFSDVVNRVFYRRESFVVERGGEAVCKIEPVGPMSMTFGELVKEWVQDSVVDEDYLNTVAELRAQQPRLPKDPWAL